MKLRNLWGWLRRSKTYKERLAIPLPPKGGSLLAKETYEAAKKVCNELLAMSPEELKAEIEAHKDGDFARMLLESGAIDLMMEDMKKETQDEKVED